MGNRLNQILVPLPHLGNLIDLSRIIVIAADRLLKSGGPGLRTSSFHRPLPIAARLLPCISKIASCGLAAAASLSIGRMSRPSIT